MDEPVDLDGEIYVDASPQMLLGAILSNGSDEEMFG